MPKGCFTSEERDIVAEYLLENYQNKWFNTTLIKSEIVRFGIFVETHVLSKFFEHLVKKHKCCIRKTTQIPFLYKIVDESRLLERLNLDGKKDVELPTLKTREISGMTFNSLESETHRVYVFPNGSNVKIHDPAWLNVSASKAHRILDDYGISHYIPFGWIHLYWEVKEGYPAFDF